MDPIDSKQTMDQVTTQESNSLNHLVAVWTSLFALVAAFAGIMASRCTTRGLVAKNEAIYLQSEIMDEWSFFQSRNIRYEISELALNFKQNQSHQTTIQEKMARLKKESDDSFKLAKSKEPKRDQWNKKSDQYLDLSKIFASALVLLQVAIVLIPLTLLTRKKQLLYTGVFMGVLGKVYLVVAVFQYFRLL